MQRKFIREIEDFEGMFNDYGGGANEPNLICPVCNMEYTHVNRVHTRLGGAEAEVYEGTLPSEGATFGERSALVIEFHCENGHPFEIVFQQHEGVNFIHVNELETYSEAEYARLYSNPLPATFFVRGF